MAVLPETLPDLELAVEDAEPVRYAAAPTIALGLRVERVGGGPVSSIVLQTQIRIAAGARPYAEGERERLAGLFGRPEQWSRSVRSLHWVSLTLAVPQFEHVTRVELAVPLTYDLEVASAQYLSALEDGEVPLELLFSGTVFYPGDGGDLRTALIPWEKEARFRLPVQVWRDAMEQHFPGQAWLRLSRRSFERLRAYRNARALPTWEHTFDALLDEAE